MSSKYRLQTALKTDERVRLMDEIISGIQVIKMYAWEKPFCTLIELARRLELKEVRKSSYIRGIFMTFFLFTTRMALYGTLMTMMLNGQELTADKVFMYMSYFNMMSMTMSGMFVRGIAEVAETKVAINRLQNFLMYEEFESGVVNDWKDKEVVETNGNSMKIITQRALENDTDEKQSNENSRKYVEKKKKTLNFRNELLNKSKIIIV